MSYEALEGRVGELEAEVNKIGREQARQGERQGRMQADLGEVADGVKKLLERDARRPEALNFRQVAITCSGLAAMAVVGWWLIGQAPAVRELEKRMDYAEWKYGWSARIDDK